MSSSGSGSGSSSRIPEVWVGGGGGMGVVGMGTAEFPFEAARTAAAVAAALELGYRHFDTAALYGSEQALGLAVADAVRRGLVSRGDVFVTSKLWCTDAHPDRVLPALRQTLRSHATATATATATTPLSPFFVFFLPFSFFNLFHNLQMDYLDLYLFHWPMSAKPGPPVFPIKREDVVPMDLKGVWEAMEECQRLGLTKAIGISNFTTKKIEELLKTAKIPPAVNQVEMNPRWQQQKLRQFCAEKGIHVTAYSPLGGQLTAGAGNPVMESEVLKEIANAKGKTVAQVSLRWIYEQGASMVVKSFNKERLKQNIEIFDWELTEEERIKISQIPQQKKVTIQVMLTEEGTCESVDLSDVDCVEM